MELGKEGVILYQSDDRDLGKPKPKTPEMALQAAQDYFEEYMGDATRFLDLHHVAVEKEYYKEAAFLLHQVVENLYQGMLLVLKFYTPYDTISFFCAISPRNSTAACLTSGRGANVRSARCI